jgi:hypothetical protein
LLLKPIWSYLLSVFQAWYEFKFTMLNLGKHWKRKCIIATNINVHTEGRALSILRTIKFFFLLIPFNQGRCISPHGHISHTPQVWC